MEIPIRILEDCCTPRKPSFGHHVSPAAGKRRQGIRVLCAALQIPFISVLKHPAEANSSDGITDGFKNEVGKALLAQTGAAIISIKCVQAHQAEANLCMAQQQMQRLTSNGTANCFKRNGVIADQGNKCILMFKREKELGQKSPANLRAVSS